MLIIEVKNENIIWGIWRIDESIDELLSQIDEDDPSLIKSSPKRLKEQASVRILLKNLMGENKRIAYSDIGKPYLTDNSYNISISHTRGYAAVILSKQNRIGIDIESISEKVNRVKDRFVSNSEYIDPNNETIHLLLHWSAKETIYKAIGCTGIDLKKDILIKKFTPQQKGQFNVQELFTDEQMMFDMYYWVNNDFVLTYTY